ncbi:hypothetical protein ACFVXQ_06720 [Kitasatospora sp. NPDC058263]
MQTDTTADQIPEPTHTWLITLQVPVGSGFVVVTRSGDSTFPPGSARGAAYGSVREWLGRRDPQLRDGVVLFFSLEPYRL